MINQEIDCLVVGDDLLEKSNEHFVANLPNESIVVIIGKVLKKNDRIFLLATDIRMPEKSDYTKQSPVFCSLSSKFLTRITLEANRDDKLVIAIAHYHPMHGLSTTDQQDGHMQMLKAGYLYCLTGYNYEGKTVFYHYDNGFKETTLKVVNTKKFDRQIRAYGYEKQLLLASSEVLVVGCGGGGFALVHNLVLKGFQKIKVVDPDCFTETSLNRVWLPSRLVGTNKAAALKTMLEEFADIEAYECTVEDLPEETFKNCDVIIAFTDSISSRLYVNRLAVRLGKSAIFLGTEIRSDATKISMMVGSCLVYQKNLPCYSCNLHVDENQLQMETLEPEKRKYFAAKYGLSADVPLVPSLVELNTITASIGSDETVKLITGYAKIIPRQYFDFLNRKIIIINEKVKSDCWDCSQIENSVIDEKDTITREEILQRTFGETI